MSDMVERLRDARSWLNNGDCCGDKDSAGICAAPACIFGEALKELYEAADEIERLRAGGCARDQTTTQFCAEAVTLQAENARLREALEPFAKAADQLDKEKWDDGSIEGSLAYVTSSHCRSARAALAEKEER